MSFVWRKLGLKTKKQKLGFLESIGIFTFTVGMFAFMYFVMIVGYAFTGSN